MEWPWTCARRLDEVTRALAEERRKHEATRAELDELSDVLDEIERDRLHQLKLHSRAVDRMNAAIREAVALRLVMWELLEPSTSGPCAKIRWNRTEDATVFAEHVRRNTGCGELKTYQCPECPPQPIPSYGGYWHIAHVDPELRHGGFKSKREARVLAQFIDPAVIAEIRNRIEG